MRTITASVPAASHSCSLYICYVRTLPPAAGDSRAVLCRKGQAVPLTSDHKPGRADEMVSTGALAALCPGHPAALLHSAQMALLGARLSGMLQHCPVPCAAYVEPRTTAIGVLHHSSSAACSSACKHTADTPIS